MNRTISLIPWRHLRRCVCGFALLIPMLLGSAQEAFGEEHTSFLGPDPALSFSRDILEGKEQLDRDDGDGGISHIEQTGDERAPDLKDSDGMRGARSRLSSRVAAEAAGSSGLFAPAEVFEVGVFTDAVGLGDINGDGRNDVVVTTHNSITRAKCPMYVLLQDEKGKLRPPIRYKAVYAPSAEVGDLNNDGKSDVVIAATLGIGIFYQNGAGGLDTMVYHPSSNGLLPLKVKVGDFNDDGLKDVVSIYWGWDGRSAHNVDIYFQNTSGTLESPVSYPVDHNGYDDLDVGDVNNDGLQDIVVMNGQGRPNVGVLLQTTGGSFDSPYYYWVGGLPGTTTTSVGVGDVSGDGLQDIVVGIPGNWPESKIAVFFQDRWGIPEIPIIYQANNNPDDLEIADVNMDGLNDVVVVQDGYVAVYLQQESGRVFDWPMLYPFPRLGYNPYQLKVGDINGDGAEDIIVADSSRGLLVLYNQYFDRYCPARLVEPNGNDVWPIGSVQTIRWKSKPDENVNIDISRDGGASWAPLFRDLPNTGRVPWEVAGPPTMAARIRVSSASDPSNTDISEADFMMSGIEVKSPNGGEKWRVGAKRSIRWTSVGVVGEVTIELSRDGGDSWETLFNNLPNEGGQMWVVRGPAARKALIRVGSTADGTIADMSNNPFSIR